MARSTEFNTAGNIIGNNGIQEEPKEFFMAQPQLGYTATNP